MTDNHEEKPFEAAKTQLATLWANNPPSDLAKEQALLLSEIIVYGRGSFRQSQRALNAIIAHKIQKQKEREKFFGSQD